MTKTGSKIERSAKAGAFSAGGKVLGTTKDGVRILKPRSKATHFTVKELQRAIAVARDAAKRPG